MRWILKHSFVGRDGEIEIPFTAKIVKLQIYPNGEKEMYYLVEDET